MEAKGAAGGATPLAAALAPHVTTAVTTARPVFGGPLLQQSPSRKPAAASVSGAAFAASRLVKCSRHIVLLGVH